jgi:hypothetical protein
MRIVALCTVMIVAVFAAGAFGGDRVAANNMAQLANEIAGKAAYRPDEGFKVQAGECRLRIEFQAHSVAFDLPLQGTKLAESASEDSVILLNNRMTRTIKDRTPEAFTSLIIRCGRNNLKAMKDVFDGAIKACDAQGTSLVAAY